MNVVRVSALPLAIIGALNWGLVGLFKFNLVAGIFGAESVLSRIVYVLVGIAGAACIGLMFDKTAARAAEPISRDREIRRVA